VGSLVRSPRFEPGSSAWQADVLDQARLRPHSTVLRYKHDGKIINLLLNLQSRGKADLTVKFVSDRLKYLAKYVNLDDPEAVNLFIARKQCLDSHKDGLVKAYNYYAQFYGISYVKPKFRCEKRLPRIPAREALMSVVSASSEKYAAIFKILMESGVMPYELANVSLKDIDLDKGTLVVRGFKGHSSRVFKLKDDTVAILKDYIRKYYCEKPFPDADWMGSVWRRVRNKLAEKLKDPNIKSIHLYDLRHFYATMLYHRTKDILLVKQQLGHKKIETTLIYTQLVQFSEEDEFYSATAKTAEEAAKLIEQGFEYVTDIDGVKLFRKRK
jgi:integrase/recombinase XerD